MYLCVNIIMRHDNLSADKSIKDGHFLKYIINKDLHSDFSVFEKNKLAPRAYAIPYADKEKLKTVSAKEERYGSDTVTVLSGEWDFKFYKSVSLLPEKLDTVRVKFGKLTVPGDWQRHGYEEPVYLNCPYQFKTMEPNVPDDMPVGVYRKFFDIADVSKTYILSFLGAANNISVYINGRFVGYSEGSHNTAEFDVSLFVAAGANELVVVTFKWCNGSFLEAQDMFRENGIFRDVLLYEYGKTYLYDCKINTEKNENGYSLSLTAATKGNAAGIIKAVLADADGTEIKSVSQNADGVTELDFGTVSVKEWTAETPVLYSVYVSLSDGENELTVRFFTGFRTIEIKDGIFLINGAPIKIKGVNHHDTDLYKGYAMSLDDMERDVTLMKELNVNGVRTSHYPPDPFFITLCDIHGLYVIDEADIETHGCWEMAGDVSYISKQSKWVPHCIDRVSRMYERDKNHVAVTMWSLGNESGGYKCQDACYKYLKTTGTAVPVHYEGVCGQKRFHYDVISEMYTSTECIDEMIAGKRKRPYDGKLSREYSKYPFFLCEYCHAMGVGPGNLEEYWERFYDWDNSMGGCIWEWADHTVYHGDGDKKYKYRYTYGGDHGEKQHDGHFCVDGLMYADRRLHTGAKEMRIVYRPLRASAAGNKLYCIENTNRFRSSDYIAIKWVLLENGVEVESGELKTDIEPMQSECFEIKHRDFDESKDAHINFIYTDTETGRAIAEEQLTLNDVPYEFDIEIGSKISASVENGIVTVDFDGGKAVFDGRTGDITEYTVNGKDILNVSPAEAHGFTFNLWRAVIDNDACSLTKWRKGGLDSLKRNLKSFDAHIDDGEIVIETVFDLCKGKKAMCEAGASYTVSSLGAIEVKASLKTVSPDAEKDIPRFGIMTELSRAFEKCEYYGRGEAENMPDFKCQAPVGIYSADIDSMFEPYVFPQESGMHCDTKKIILSASDGTKLAIYADDKVNFSIHHFTQSALDRAKHQEDVKDMNTTVLTLDGFTRGIGSSSCGPDTRAEYRADASLGYSFGFTLIPLTD